MKKILIAFMCLLAGMAFAATPSIKPNADGEGSVGTSTQAWACGYFKSALYVNGNIVLTNAAGGGTTNLFAGQDTTGLITSVSGDAGKYLRADGTWVTVTGGGTTNLFAGAGTTGLVTSTTSDTNSVLFGDGTWKPSMNALNETTNGNILAYVVSAGSTGIVGIVDDMLRPVSTNLSNFTSITNDHAQLNGTAAHGLGDISTRSSNDFASAAQGIKANTAWQNTTSVSNFLYTTNNNEITITGYIGETPAVLQIPDMINGLPVTTLGYSSFDNNATITTVIGGKNLTTIGFGVFHANGALASIYLPAVTNISATAFRFDTALVSVYLPALTSVGVTAFESCTALTHVSLPSLTSIGASAFKTCTALTNVFLPSVTSIGDAAFYGSTLLTSVYFNQGAPSVGVYLYYDAPSVTNYVSNPLAFGWGSTFGGRPVVLLYSSASLTSMGLITTNGNGSALTNYPFSCTLSYGVASNNTNEIVWWGDVQKACVITNISWGNTVGNIIGDLYKASNSVPFSAKDYICYTGLSFIANTAPSNIAVNISLTVGQRVGWMATNGVSTNAYVILSGHE